MATLDAETGPATIASTHEVVVTKTFFAADTVEKSTVVLHAGVTGRIGELVTLKSSHLTNEGTLTVPNGAINALYCNGATLLTNRGTLVVDSERPGPAGIGREEGRESGSGLLVNEGTLKKTKDGKAPDRRPS